MRSRKDNGREDGDPVMSDVTRLLEAAERGDRRAASELLPLVYNELRRLAAAMLTHEKPGQTLNANARVHEGYLRLIGAGSVSDGFPEQWPLPRRSHRRRSEVGSGCSYPVSKLEESRACAALRAVPVTRQ